MNDPLDRLEQQAEIVARRAQYEQANRRGLLWAHAAIGVGSGLAMLLYGSSSTLENNIGVWIRPVLGALGITGGAFIGWGLTTRPRNLALEAAGLVLVGVWDLLMFSGFVHARLSQNQFDPIPLGSAMPDGYIAAYPNAVYGGLAALVGLHLWTLWRLHRASLKGQT